MIDKIEAVGASLPSSVRDGKQDAKPAKSAEPKSTPVQAPVVPSYGFLLRVDEHTHEVTAVIVDPVTRAPIQEIPAEEMQTASKVIRNLLGPLVDKIV